jgi:RNA polymerase sigma factor (sigma-70 family)
MEIPAMLEPMAFSHFVSRLRAGDEQAAAELVRRYEPLIRREVRMHLEDQHLCRLFDSLDISQAVLLSFFVRSAAGQYDLEQPEQLLNLLVSMTRNKLASAARRENRQRRDQRRTAGSDSEELAAVADGRPAAEDVVASAELLQRIHQHLSEEERQLVELRGGGVSWEEIAAQRGGTAQARRMQLGRALDRVARQLGVILEDA